MSIFQKCVRPRLFHRLTLFKPSWDAVLILFKLFQRIEKEETFLSYFYKVSVTLISKPDQVQKKKTK